MIFWNSSFRDRDSMDPKEKATLESSDSDSTTKDDANESSANSIRTDQSPSSSLDRDSANGGAVDSPSVWSGFYKKSIQTRQDQLRLVYPRLPTNTTLPNNIADNMIENCIGIFKICFKKTNEAVNVFGLCDRMMDDTDTV